MKLLVYESAAIAVTEYGSLEEKWKVYIVMEYSRPFASMAVPSA